MPTSSNGSGKMCIRDRENNSGTETDTSVEGSAEGENTEDSHSESDKSDGNTTEEGNTDAGDSESNQEQQGTSNHEDEITEQGGFGYGESNQLSDLLACLLYTSRCV